MPYQFAIIGGGIAGLATAIALRRIGLEVRVYEASPEIKALGAGLVLAANAIQAFQRIGIADVILAEGKELPSFSILDSKGRTIVYNDSARLSRQYGVDNFTIHRGDLHKVLLAQLPADIIHTGKRAISFTTEKEKLLVQFEDGTQAGADFLLVADGIHSSIRRQLIPGSQTRYAGYTCWRGLVDNTQLQWKQTSETWGPRGRFGIVPLAGNRIYWFACLNAPPQSPLMKSYGIGELLEQFKGYHYPIPEILAQTKRENLLWNDIIDLAPVSRYAFGPVVLLGDAGHATTPNMGQGACQAIEDAVVLMQCLQDQPRDPAAAFVAFEQRRLKRTHFIVNNSWSLGRLAQWENPLACAVRNALFRLIPAGVRERQLRFVYEVDF